MKIVVCVKQVPDTAAERKLKAADSTLDRASVDSDPVMTRSKPVCLST